MIIMPTRGRPESVKRFARCYVETQASEPLTMVIDHDDKSYDKLELPPQFTVKVMPPHGGIGDCFNAMLEEHPDEVVYGVVADDVVPQTPHWDQLLKTACLPFGLSWGNDGVQGEKLCTHPFIAGDLARAIGWIAYPKTKHWFVDNVWKDIAIGVGHAAYLPDVHTPHFHVMNGKAELDETYMNQPSRERDFQAYAEFKKLHYEPLIARLKQMAPVAA